jgi:hypothetical protein
MFSEFSTGEGHSGNAIIHADNLPAMAALTPALRSRVDLAFLDPPYNAARERWTYPDQILGWFGSVVGTEGEDPLRHDKWLSMMYPRLSLLRGLLAESGVIFMTLDDHEVHHARVLMDEIFGPENLLANITWEKTQTPLFGHRIVLPRDPHPPDCLRQERRDLAPQSLRGQGTHHLERRRGRRP